MFTNVSRRTSGELQLIHRKLLVISAIALKTFFVVSFVLLTSVALMAATYTGTNTGAIPDGPTGSRSCGTPRDVQFNVAGFTGNFGAVSVSFTATHTYVGDLEVTLIAPNGAAHLLFSFVGSNSNTDPGDSSNLGATYSFLDTATSNFWAAAAGVGNNANVPGGSYRTQAAGPFANDNPGPPFTNMNSTFAGLTQAQINGTWILRFRDCWQADTGSVSAASLLLLPLSAGPATVEGRVVTSDGRGIKNALIEVTGGNLTEPRYVITNTFGFYRIPDLESGQSYVFAVRAKKYNFRENPIFISVEQDLRGIDFIADPF